MALLRELVFHAVLIHPKNPQAHTLTGDVWAMASAVGQHIHILHASTVSEVEAAFGTEVPLILLALANEVIE